MKKSFITITLAVVLIVGGTAIYSTQKNIKKTKITFQNQTLEKTNQRSSNIQNSVASTQIKSTAQTTKIDSKNVVSKHLEPETITQNKKSSLKTNNETIATATIVSNVNAITTENKKRITSNGEQLKIKKVPNTNVTLDNDSSNTTKILNKENTTMKSKINTNKRSPDTKNNTAKTTSVKSQDTQDKTKIKNTTNLTNSQIYARLKTIINKTSGKRVAFVTNLNDYKIVNGKKYYNLYEYSIGNKSNDWSFKGNYSNFIGAKYMDIDGDVLQTQFIQNFKNTSLRTKKEYIQNLIDQFAEYFPSINGNISIDMSKTMNFEGYHCYLVHFGIHNIYITPAGFIYIDKKNSFY